MTNSPPILHYASPEEAEKNIKTLEVALSNALSDLEVRSKIAAMVVEAARGLISTAVPTSALLHWDEPLDLVFAEYVSARPPFDISETVQSISEDMRKNYPHLIEIAALMYYKEYMARAAGDNAILADPAISEFMLVLQRSNSKDRATIKTALSTFFPDF